MHTIKWITLLVLLIEDIALLTTADTKNERWQELTTTSTVNILDISYKVVYSDDITTIPKPKCLKLFMGNGLYVTVDNKGKTFRLDYNKKKSEPVDDNMCKVDMTFTWAKEILFSVIEKTTLYVQKNETMSNMSVRSKIYRTKPTKRKVLTAIGDKKTKTAFTIFQKEGASNDMGILYVYSFRSATETQIVPHQLDLFGDKVLAIDVDLTSSDIALAIDNGPHWRLVVLKYEDQNPEYVVSSVENVGLNYAIPTRSLLINRFDDESQLTTGSIKSRAKAMLDYYIGHARRCEKMWHVMIDDAESRDNMNKTLELRQAIDSISTALFSLEDLYRRQVSACS